MLQEDVFIIIRCLILPRAYLTFFMWRNFQPWSFFLSCRILNFFLLKVFFNWVWIGDRSVLNIRRISGLHKYFVEGWLVEGWVVYVIVLIFEVLHQLCSTLCQIMEFLLFFLHCLYLLLFEEWLVKVITFQIC